MFYYRITSYLSKVGPRSCFKIKPANPFYAIVFLLLYKYASWRFFVKKIKIALKCLSSLPLSLYFSISFFLSLFLSLFLYLFVSLFLSLSIYINAIIFVKLLKNVPQIRQFCDFIKYDFIL